MDVVAVDLTPEELAATDLAVVVTDHDDFDWDLLAEAAIPVFDTRHRLAEHPHVQYL
jgi:UDP-N-acetyl-D-mannosaminuronate dehydrogenase